jgi:hypothetical protein
MGHARVPPAPAVDGRRMHPRRPAHAGRPAWVPRVGRGPWGGVGGGALSKKGMMRRRQAGRAALPWCNRHRPAKPAGSGAWLQGVASMGCGRGQRCRPMPIGHGARPGAGARGGGGGAGRAGCGAHHGPQQRLPGARGEHEAVQAPAAPAAPSVRARGPRAVGARAPRRRPPPPPDRCAPLGQRRVPAPPQSVAARLDQRKARQRRAQRALAPRAPPAQRRSRPGAGPPAASAYKGGAVALIPASREEAPRQHPICGCRQRSPDSPRAAPHGPILAAPQPLAGPHG